MPGTLNELVEVGTFQRGRLNPKEVDSLLYSLVDLEENEQYNLQW